MIEFEMELNCYIKVRVIAEHQKAEISTRTYPGCPEAMLIEDIELPDRAELKDMILKDYSLELEEAAWDHR